MFLWLTAILSVSLSLVAKVLADELLSDRVAVLGSYAGLQYSLNPGVAFGLRFPPAVQLPLILIALLIIGYVAWSSAKTRLSQIGFGLIIGGALGNIIDRMRDGFVTDFFQVGTFPIFNVADSCITIGVLFLLWEITVQRMEKQSRS